MIVLWLPIAVALSLALRPDPQSERPSEIVVFAIAIWGAYLIRTMSPVRASGCSCFWTTRGAAIFELCMTLELLLSGRLVPLPLMPDWVQELARFLPVPVGVLLPDPERSSATSRTPSSFGGLAMQLLWILVGLAIFSCRLAVGDPTLHGGGRLT